MAAHDMLHNLLYPKDVVVYPVRKGSSLWMSVGVVVESDKYSIKVLIEVEKWGWVSEDHSDIKNFPTYRTVTVPSLDRVIKVDNTLTYKSNLILRLLTEYEKRGCAGEYKDE